MKTLAVIGSNGMVGSDLIRYLNDKFDVTAINRENYQSNIGKSFDILINANGNSKRFWANQHPKDDFVASTLSVINSIFDFKSKFYIYLSSPDVYENHSSPKSTKESQNIDPKNLSAYGFHKYLGELIVKKYQEKFLILRLSMILGTNLKKGPIFDILQGNSLFITLDSKLQIITTEALAKIIIALLKKSVSNATINVGGIDSLVFTKVNQYFRKIKVSSEAVKQTYQMNIEKLKNFYPTLQTSEEYLRQFLKNYEKERL